MADYVCKLDFDQAKWVLNYMPRSHFRLFELIAKFLGVYIKCFLGENTLHQIKPLSGVYKIVRLRMRSNLSICLFAITADFNSRFYLFIFL